MCLTTIVMQVIHFIENVMLYISTIHCDIIKQRERQWNVKGYKLLGFQTTAKLLIIKIICVYSLVCI